LNQDDAAITPKNDFVTFVIDLPFSSDTDDLSACNHRDMSVWCRQSKNPAKRQKSSETFRRSSMHHNSLLKIAHFTIGTSPTIAVDEECSKQNEAEAS
jgi:hypothetical protein